MPPEPGSGRARDVSGLSAGELERARRELSASLALSRSDALSAVTAVHLGAVEAELSERRRATGVLVCSCGYGTDNPIRFDAHLDNNPDHEPYDQP